MTDVYSTYRDHLLADLLTSDVKVAILDATFTADDAHEFLDDISASVIDSSGNLSTKAVTDGRFNSDPAVVSSATGSDVAAVAMYIDTTVASTSRLVAYWSTTDTSAPIDVTLDGTDLTITPHTLGWFTI